MNKRIMLWLFGGFCASAMFALALLQVSFAHGWIEFASDDRLVGHVLLATAAVFGLLFLFFAIGIGIYVYRDARQRGMEPIVWTLVAIFIPYFIGLIIYLVTRKPLQSTCPSCGAGAPWKAPFCPSCGRAICRVCPKCQTSVQNGARFCHACGLELVKV
jgi:hypothetical protein